MELMELMELACCFGAPECSAIDARLHGRPTEDPGPLHGAPTARPTLARSPGLWNQTRWDYSCGCLLQAISTHCSNRAKADTNEA